MTWNFNMTEAPQDKSILAADDTDIITRTKWIAEEGRWNMFTKDSPPIAWQLWPEHPNAKTKGKENLENMFE